MSGPQIWLCLFTFRPIVSKKLNGLSTIDALSWLDGAVVTHLIWVQELRQGFLCLIFCLVVVVFLLFFQNTHYLSQKFAIPFTILIIIPPPGGGLYRIRFVASVGPLYIHLLMEGFPSNLNDTFSSTRGCAEPMLPMCQLKVKVTVKGQIFNKQILHIMLCPLYNSFTNGRISLKLEWHIQLN